jgi:SAM-dependent methyltransferase
VKVSASKITSDARAHIYRTWADVAPTWGDQAEEVEQRAAAITSLMIDGLAAPGGSRVLDLACGPGAAGLAAAERVGARGEVVLSDVVPAMVDIAVRRARARGLTNVRGSVLDLEGVAESDCSCDAVLWREGMMFAVDPAEAAQEMWPVLPPSGRVAVAVWASRQDNPWLGLLFDAITEVTGITVPLPGIPGPFALSDPDRLRTLFTQAGFTDIAVNAVEVPFRPPSFDAWWERSLAVAGPVIALLNRLDGTARARVRDAARRAALPYLTDHSLELPGLANLLTGRRP